MFTANWEQAVCDNANMKVDTFPMKYVVSVLTLTHLPIEEITWACTLYNIWG